MQTTKTKKNAEFHNKLMQYIQFMLLAHVLPLYMVNVVLPQPSYNNDLHSRALLWKKIENLRPGLLHLFPCIPPCGPGSEGKLGEFVVQLSRWMPDLTAAEAVE